MIQRPGFVSPTGIVVAVLLLLGILTWTLVGGLGLFSSGPLNASAKGPALGGVTSHSQLADDCGACHPAPWSSRTMADACLDCHTEVGEQVTAKKGLHGRLLGTLSSPTCRGCHPEHNGPDGALTVLNAASFPHDLTGYSLSDHRRTAAGNAFTCADCHGKDLATFDQATCADCHAEIDAAFMRRHEAEFGEECLACHDGSGSDGDGFDHSKVQSTPCYSCHAEDDAHQGAYGRQCGDCHTPESWSDATFEHSVFPLDHGSDEQTATCETCHPLNTSTYTCYGCHAHTEANVVAQHEGESLAELADCIDCHPGGRQGDEGDEGDD